MKQRPDAAEIITISGPMVMALAGVLMHFYQRDDAWLRLLRSDACWLAALAFFFVGWPLLMGPVVLTMRRRRRRSGRAVDPAARRFSILRTRRFLVQSSLSNVQLVGLLTALVIVVGTPWWAVLLPSGLLVVGLVAVAIATRRLRSLTVEPSVSAPL